MKNIVGTHAVFHSTCDSETVHIRSVFGADAKVVQIPNFIELPELVERKDGRYLLFVGRLHPKKAVDDLIRALSMSRGFSGSGLVLKIAGRGTASYERDLRRLVDELGLSDQVEFAGQVDGQAKQQVFANARWTFMPSHTENFGMVVLESLAQNTPVIASRSTPWEMLEKVKLGFWVDNSPESLAVTIDKILEMDDAEYARYRQGGREFVADRFSVAEHSARWVEVYRSEIG